MEAKEIRAYLDKHANTKTYIINMCIGLCVFLLLGGIAKVVSAEESGFTKELEEATDLPAESTALSDRSQKRILALANNMSEKMRAAIARHEQITERLEKRLEIIQTDGELIDPATNQYLAEAKNATAQAKTIVETELDMLVDNTVYSETPQENWHEARTRYQEAAALIRTSYQLLGQIVR